MTITKDTTTSDRTEHETAAAAAAATASEEATTTTTTTTTTTSSTTFTKPEASNGNGASALDDKSHTFRKRRLSLTNVTKADEDGTPDEANDGATPTKERDSYGYEDHLPILPHPNSEDDDKAHTFRKRRLSLTHSREDGSVGSHGEADEPPFQRRRRASDASISSLESGSTNLLKSRTVHASELLAQPPLSPAVLPRLYQQSAPPQQPDILGSMEEDSSMPPPKWWKRHTRLLHEDERTLPFPRDIVGTFSCHGVEPIYDSDYQPEDDDESEEESPSGWGTLRTPTKKDQDAADRPVTAAKINQDRGGVAFPYGNCAHTALFAAYDGKHVGYMENSFGSKLNGRITNMMVF